MSRIASGLPPRAAFGRAELRSAKSAVRGDVRGDVQLLHHMLLSRFGTLVAAWRLVLDQDGSGQVSRKEFLSACRSLQFPGDASVVFDALADKDDELSLFAFDKEAAELLSEFAVFIREEFGSVEEAFTSGLAFGSRHANRIEFQTFMHACMEMNFRSNNFKRLFECLDFDRSGFLTLDELQFLESWRADLFVPPPSLDEMLSDTLQRHRPLDEACALVEQGANPNRPRNRAHIFTDDDSNALSQAVERGTAMHVQRLLACRADPNLANVYGRTPLHGAAARGNCRVDVTRLIQHLYTARADPNIATADGTTPLHIACGAGHAPTVAMLVYIGANVHARDAQHRNPLWLSIFRKSMPCCSALLQFLADPCRRCKGEVTALEYAIETQQWDVADALQVHVQANYEVLLKAAARDLGKAFEQELYLDLLEEVPDSQLTEVLRTLDWHVQKYCV